MGSPGCSAHVLTWQAWCCDGWPTPLRLTLRDPGCGRRGGVGASEVRHDPVPRDRQTPAAASISRPYEVGHGNTQLKCAGPDDLREVALHPAQCRWTCPCSSPISWEKVAALSSARARCRRQISTLLATPARYFPCAATVERMGRHHSALHARVALAGGLLRAWTDVRRPGLVSRLWHSLAGANRRARDPGQQVPDCRGLDAQLAL